MSDKSQQDQQTHTAYHEAGHAVACCLLDIPFLYTTITPPEEVGGVGFTHTIPRENPSRQELYDEMVVLAAGIAASTFFPGGYHEDAFLAGSGDDLECIRSYAAHLATDTDEDRQLEEYQRLIDQAHIRANELLRTPAHRAAVGRVVEALLEKQTLDAMVVRQLIGKPD